MFRKFCYVIFGMGHTSFQEYDSVLCHKIGLEYHFT